MTTTFNSIAFFGASTGIGLAALKTILSTSSTTTCAALCRIPSKLTSKIPSNTNLKVVPGNAHDLESVTKTLLSGPNDTPVDAILTSIGGRFIASKLSIDDPEVCRKGMTVLLEAITNIRKSHPNFKPYVVCFSTTGISQHGRDIPLVMVPLYKVLLRTPHVDKEIMESKLWESGETFTVVRASLLVDGEASEKVIRVGIEDPKTGHEKKEIGYTISREDAGKWVAENLLVGGRKEEYLDKNVSITY